MRVQLGVSNEPVLSIECPWFGLSPSIAKAFILFLHVQGYLETIFHDSVALLHVFIVKHWLPFFSIISRMFHHECLWNIGYNISVDFPPCIRTGLYNKGNILLWSKGQACLLPTIKHLGSLSSEFLSWTQHTVCAGAIYLSLHYPGENGVYRSTKDSDTLATAVLQVGNCPSSLT